MRTGTIALALFTILTVAVSAAYACVGARPLAMGGAFIALADDANATYWNPAGLAQIPVGQMLGTWTHTGTNRSEVNYQEFASFAGSFASSRFFSRMALGVSYVKNDTNLLLGSDRVADTQEWFWASLAADTGKFGMFGLNVRKVDDSATGYSIDSDLALDVGYLYRVSPELSVGVLAQDINEPQIKAVGFSPINHLRNWRAGLAFRPAKGMVVTLDGYDLENNAGQQSARFGIEKQFRNFTVRGGYYGAGSQTNKGATFGLGISKELYDIDAAVLMGDFDNTVMLSAGFKL